MKNKFLIPYFFFSFLGLGIWNLEFGTFLSAQECNIIYVSPTGASSGVTGTRANPASLQYAFNLVSSTAKRLWLATGTYNISIKLSIPDSVTMEGGFDPATWTKSNSAESIIARDNLNLSPSTALIGLEGISKNAFRLQDLTITVASAPGNGNSVYGIYLSNCSNYNIVRCKVIAGDGSPGMSGTPGTIGTPGGNGSNGLPACNENCVPAGGAGGVGVGGNNGGNGGAGAKHNPNGSEIGAAGLSAGCGGGGGNGGDGPSCGCGIFGTSNNSSCSGSSPSQGQNGNAGTNGSSGISGTSGSIVGGFWVPGTAGGNGTAGTSGCGGGGGGGGAGRQQNGSDDVGGSGGGGGGGGESGTGGTGGTGGGSSYAIFLVNNGTGGIIQDCDAQNGASGIGGAGGAGGSGGAGGAGGTGGSGFGCGISNGANGGNGGSGGSGGSGGQGASGESAPLSENGGTPVSVTGAPNVPGNPPLINANFYGCTNAEVIFSGTGTSWNFGAGATPASAIGNGPHSVYYSSFGRKTITLDGAGFTEYVDIFKTGPTLPSITPNGGSVTVGCPNSFSTNISGTNYQWIFGNNALPDTVSGSSFQTVDTVLFTSQGTYTIQLYVNTTCCGKVRDTTVVTVTPSTLNVAMTASPSTICQGSPTTFTATPNTYLLYTFYVNNSVAQASTSNSFTTSSLVPGDSVMVIGFAGACFTNPSAVIYPTVNVIPSVTVTSSDGDNTICAGESVTFTASPTGYDNYEFFDGTTSLQSGTATLTTTALASGNSITIVATDNNCPSPASNAIVTTVNPLPVITLTSSDVDTIICAGDALTFTATPAGVANYDFSINGSSVQNGASNTYSSSAVTNGSIINIVATSSAGCPGPISNSLTFTVNPIPTVSLIATDDSICPGTNVIFTATPPGNDSYEFFDGTNPVQDSAANSYSASALVNGNNITVVATDLECSSPVSNALSVYVYPAPSVTLTSTDADSTICSGDTVTFTANPSGYNTYQFSLNGIQVQSSSSNIFISGSLSDNDVISAIAIDFSCPSLQSSIGFSVNPFATVNAGTDATICAGSIHTLSGTIGGSATSSIWTTGGNGTFDDAALSNAAYTPSPSDTANGSIVLTLTTNDPDGSGPCPSVNDLVLLTINPEATVSAGADATICADTTQLLNGAIGGSATANVWTTSGSGTFDNSSLATAAYSPSPADISTGSVILTITTDDPDGSGPCPTASDAMILTINPIPTAFLSPSASSICEDSSVYFTTSFNPAADSCWFFLNGVQIQSGINFNYTTTAFSDSDTLTATVSNLGCKSTLSNAVSITVNPTPSVILSASAAEICLGDSITFTADSAGYDNYMFINGINLLQSGASNTYTTTSLAQGNSITVIATDLACPSPQSNAISVTVNPLPVVTITSNDPNNAICRGLSIVLTAAGGTSFLWSTGETGNPITQSPLNDTTYTAIATDAKGCKNSGSINVIVYQKNNVSAGNDVYVCNKAGVQLNATAGFFSYQWFPATGLNNPNIINPVANPDSATLYIVMVTDGNNCSNVDTVIATPSSVIADAGADVTINYGQENPLAASGGTQYQWFPSSGLNCANCQNPLASPLETTTYTLTVTNDDGCSDVDSVTVEVIIPTEVFVPDAFSPNNDGQNDKLFVRGAAIAELSFVVYDRWGEKVFETTDKKTGWDGTIKGQNADATVYVYVLYAKIVNGFEVKKKGDITLMR